MPSGIGLHAGAAHGGEAVLLRFTTDGSGGVTVKQGEWDSRFSLSDFASGVSTLSFPKSLSVVFGHGETETDSATPGSRQSLTVKGQDYTAGTAVVRCVDEVSRAAESAVSITGSLLLFVR